MVDKHTGKGGAGAAVRSITWSCEARGPDEEARLMRVRRAFAPDAHRARDGLTHGHGAVAGLVVLVLGVLVFGGV